tara:strand:+ start:1527 stop:3938 length:2412 start_codon:yes stop_codon:yes gene_type:complete
MSKLIGTNPNQISSNADLGTAAFMDKEEFLLSKGSKISAIRAVINKTALNVKVYDTSLDFDGGAWRKVTNNTSWYNEPLNTATRGSRREFPSIAVIVSTTTQVAIYDADDPNLPMWMILEETGVIAWASGGVPTNISIDMKNGVLVWGTDNRGSGLANFATDEIEVWHGATEYVLLDKTISSRHVPDFQATSGGGGYSVAHATLHAVAVTGLSTSPVHPVTGLPYPTIALGHSNGITIINDTGSVTNVTSSYGPTSRSTYLSFIGDSFITHLGTGADRSWAHVWDKVPTATTTVTVNNDTVSAGTAPYAWFDTQKRAIANMGNDVWIRGVGGSEQIDATAISQDGKVFLGTGEGLTTIDLDRETSPGHSIINYVGKDYNTGSAIGRPSLLALSDTTVSSLSGNELVTNTNFTSGTTGWTADQASISAGSNKLTITPNSGVNGGVYDAITTVIGRSYIFKVKVLNDAAGNLSRMFAGTSNSITSANKNNLASKFAMGNGNHFIQFTATTTTTYLWLEVGGGTQQATEFDDASCKEADRDFSENGAGLYTNGTVTKVPVASGAELQSYFYGPGTTNKQTQFYNHEYNFTGDFHLSVWVKGTAGDVEIWWADASGDNGWMIYHNANTAYFLDGNWNAYSQYQQTNNDISLKGKWSKIDYVRDNHILTYYLNGKKVGYGGTSNSNDKDLSGWTLTNTTGHTLSVGTPASGSDSHLALLHITCGKAPTVTQIRKMYDDDKHLFANEAKATLYGTSNHITGLGYDDVTKVLHVGTLSGRSDFDSLSRINSTTSGITSRISASHGVIAEE